MPNKYQRKSLRGNWNEESLKAAIAALKNGEMTVYAASKAFDIPRKTLERRFKHNNDKKGPMGPSSFFGEATENKLANHIKLMQDRCFPLTIDDLRTNAYLLAEQLKLKHRFNKNTEKAGYDFVHLFLRRHPDIVLRKSEGVSIARTTSMNKTEVDDYFAKLEQIIMIDGVMMEPNHIFNMDETGVQLNNRPGHVLAQKGSKAVATVTSTEKGETITVIACCNAEGTFLPPACIMKGKNKKAEFQDGMPPGSKIFMSQKSAYITSPIFLEWLKTHFVPRKPAGKVLLLLDGHSTHCNSVEMLEYAQDNDIELLSMPSHTSHYLQPLDRAVFKSLKTHFYEQCRLWLNQNPGRRITRLSFGTLLSKAWGKAACAENAIAGFKSTGVCPFDPSAIPDYAFKIEESALPIQNIDTSNVTSTHDQASCSSSGSMASLTQALKILEQPISKPLPIAETTSFSEKSRLLNMSPEMLPQKKPKMINEAAGDEKQPTTPNLLGTKKNENIPDLTPTQILKDISPIPQALIQVRKRAKQVATLLTSTEHIQMRKSKEDMKNIKTLNSVAKKNMKKETKPAVKSAPRKRKSLRRIPDISDDNEQLVLCDESDEENDPSLLIEEDNCVGCGENYFVTRLLEDWLQCITCQLWVHENCTEYDDMCSKCGQKNKKELKLKRKNEKMEKK